MPGWMAGTRAPSRRTVSATGMARSRSPVPSWSGGTSLDTHGTPGVGMPLHHAADAAHELRIAPPQRRMASSGMASGALSCGTTSLSQIWASGPGQWLTGVGLELASLGTALVALGCLTAAPRRAWLEYSQ